MHVFIELENKSTFISHNVIDFLILFIHFKINDIGQLGNRLKKNETAVIQSLSQIFIFK